MRLYRDAICAHGTNISLITVDDRTKIGDTVSNKLQNILDSNTYEVLGIVDVLSHNDRVRVDEIIKMIQREKDKIDIMRENVIAGIRDRRDFIKQEMLFLKMYNDAKKSIIDICRELREGTQMTDYSINKQDKQYEISVKTDDAYLAAKLIKIIREHDAPVELTSSGTNIRHILDNTDVFPSD